MSDGWEKAVETVLRSMAEEIAAAAPRGWKRAVLRGYATGSDSAGHNGFWYEPRELNEYDNDVEVFIGLRELHTLMEATDRLTVELEVESRGRFEALLSERLDRSGDRGFRYVLDPETGPPEPEARVSPAVPEAGDPGEAVALLGDFQRRLEAALGLGTELGLPPPLPVSVRREILADLDVALPRDLKALYAVVNGDGGRGLLHGYGWYPLELLAEVCDPNRRWWVTRDWRSHLFRPLINEYGPPLAIQRLRDHSGWIPFATDTTGNYLAVDMAPGPRGRPGQVILIGRDHDDGPTYVADSVTELLRRHVAALEPGAFEPTDDGLWIKAGHPEDHRRRYDEACKLEVVGRDAAPVRGMGPEIRELTVSNAPWIDFDPVRGAVALWQVKVSNCPGADLSPLREAPVEVLDLAMDNIDLAGLEGHPAVRMVTLRTEKPVDLRPLLSCPQLYALDLSDAIAENLAVLGGATGLRYLKMQRLQWEELCLQKAVPPSLVIAELAEEPPQERKLYWSFDKAYKKPRPTLKDAVELAENLAGEDAGIWTFKGRFRAPG